MSDCDSSWRNSFTPTCETADMLRFSIGEFIAQHSEALGSLDGNEVVARVSRIETKLLLWTVIVLYRSSGMS